MRPSPAAGARAPASPAPLRVVVADDEPIAAAALSAALGALGCDVVAVASDGRAAIAACAATHPDACFTDVVMPGADGLAVARALRAAAPGVRLVFVSAHPHYAVAAYGADVIDFVPKPARRDRLADAVARVRRSRALMGERTDGERHAQDRDRDRADGDRLLVPERGCVHVVPVGEVEWVQADGCYLWLHTAPRAWLLRERMHRMAERLAGVGFVRVHRSALVRLGAVRALEVPLDAEPAVVLHSGVRVRVARDQVAVLRALLRC